MKYANYKFTRLSGEEISQLIALRDIGAPNIFTKEDLFDWMRSGEEKLTNGESAWTNIEYLIDDIASMGGNNWNNFNCFAINAYGTLVPIVKDIEVVNLSSHESEEEALLFLKNTNGAVIHFDAYDTAEDTVK